MTLKREKHRMALLRKELGLNQESFAEIVDRKKSSIVAIEVGKLNLSNGLAQRINHETGIKIGWLLGKGPKNPILNDFGNKYSRSDYEQKQSLKKGGEKDLNAFKDLEFLSSTGLAQVIERICWITPAAAKKEALPLWLYKIETFISEMEAEFGTEPAAKELGRKLWEESRLVDRSGFSDLQIQIAHHFKVSVGFSAMNLVDQNPELHKPPDDMSAEAPNTTRSKGKRLPQKKITKKPRKR